MEGVHSAAEPIGYSDSPLTISQPPDIKHWFSSYVYESLGLSSVREEEDKYIPVADKDHKPMNKNIQETNLYESSLLSEPPPDIGNWFSSYAYESPPILDTNDALYFSVGGEDSEYVKETQTEEEETKEIGGKDVSHSLFAQQRVSSANVTDVSQSEHLLSEPPDVGNWFSSYEYQSPHLSDTHELDFCSPEKDELIVEESDTEEENSSCIFRKTKSSKQETIIAPGRLKPNDCNESMATDTEAKEVSAYLNQEREKKKSPVSLLNASTRDKVEQESRSFKEVPSVCEMNDEPSCFSHSGVSCYNPKPPQSLAHLQEELRPKQNNHETIPTSASMQETPRKSAQKEENQESDGKENVDGESTESGFVTMKKARFRESRDQSGMTKPNREECSRSRELKQMFREEDEEERKKKRRVVGEMSNHQLSGGEEVEGKWSCPQKKKRKSGPPLKQLRLDAWVHKV